MARLLGVKLLTLEGVVLVSPAQVSQDGVREVGVQQLPRASPGSGKPRLDGVSRVSSLGEAARLLDECTEELRVLDEDRFSRD